MSFDLGFGSESRQMQKWVGIDFGTTNSAIAVASADGTINVARFPIGSDFTETYRSVLYFEQVMEGHRLYMRLHTGPDAIQRYMASEEKGRMIQSLKSLLPNNLVRSTKIFGNTYLLEDMIRLLMEQLRKKAEGSLGELGSRSVVGRPVRFSGVGEAGDDDLAMSRLRDALTRVGMTETTFEYEPIAAAYYYESLLTKDELILVADFGGGTSDFSLLHVGPSMRNQEVERKILGSEGLPVAGDAFDAKIVRHMVSELLGKGSLYKSLGKQLEMPTWIYNRLERWHHLSFLKNKDTLDLLASLRINALEPVKMDNLINIINSDLGLNMHQAVQQLKVALSTQDSSVFNLELPGISLSRSVSRVEFDSWIQEELNHISAQLDRLFRSSGTSPKHIDRVFLTGGSSFVPAVRNIFLRMFDQKRLVTGSEFTSVAKGLALRSMELYPA